MLSKKDKQAIDSRHEVLKLKLQTEYKKNTRKEFHDKLESTFSKLDIMVNAAQPEDASWIENAVKKGVKVLKVLGKVIGVAGPVVVKVVEIAMKSSLG